jgi:hypothetical protein
MLIANYSNIWLYALVIGYAAASSVGVTVRQRVPATIGLIC